MKILGSLLFGLFCVTNLSHAETFPYSDMVPKDCLVWNDGCNDCTKKSDNSWDCPERNCFNEMAGYCKMSSDEAVKPVVVEKIMPPVPNAPAGCTKWFDG